jgi:hypothetical protein
LRTIVRSPRKALRMVFGMNGCLCPGALSVRRGWRAFALVRATKPYG